MHEFIDPFAPKFDLYDDAVQGESRRESSTLNENGVPKGTTKEVLAWVGNNPARAVQALDVEAQDPTPRKGLVRELFERAGDMAELRDYPQFGGYDGKGGTGGSGVPDVQTIKGGSGDVTADADKIGVEPNKGGQDATYGTSVPQGQLADTGEGSADEVTQPDGTKGGHDATYGSGVPADQVADVEPDAEQDRPASFADHATALKGERAEDKNPATSTQGQTFGEKSDDDDK